MNTNNEALNEEQTGTTDAFLAGMNPDADVTADQQEQQTEEQAEETEEVTEDATDDAEPEEQTEDTTEDATEDDANQTAAQPEASWELKTIEGKRTMKASEITPEVLQKGLDYDRVRTKYDESKPVMELFGTLAKAQNMTIPEYTAFIRAETKKAEGMTEEQARKEIDLEDRERRMAAKENAEKTTENAEDERNARIKADLDEFSRAFPEVYDLMAADKDAIPQEVWDYAEKHDLSLTASYSRYAAQEAKKQAEAAQAAVAAATENAKNAHRSTGSMSTAGGNKQVKKDPFLAGLEG